MDVERARARIYHTSLEGRLTAQLILDERTETRLPMRRRLVNARLLALLGLIRVSSELAYSKVLPLKTLQRPPPALLGNYQGLTSMELVALTGQEKAQISRAVSAMSELGLIERASLRARILLSPAGRAMFGTMMDLARSRNLRLTAGIPADELVRFGEMTRRLTDRAALMLGRERQASGDEADDEEQEPDTEGGAIPERVRKLDAEQPLASLIAPRLMTLTAYLTRSATLTYRRETGLSHFAWQTLSQIGEHQPIPLARLIAITHRDKSQVGRTVKALSADGLVHRASTPGRREVWLSCTDAGSALYTRMCDSALQRDAFLFAETGPGERDGYLATIDKLTANAEAWLAEQDRADAVIARRIIGREDGA